MQELLTEGIEYQVDNTGESYDWSISPFKNLNQSRRKTIGFHVVLKRNPNPFYINTYLPTGLLTIISFIGFVIPVDLVPGRMALLVTIFLMLVNISSTERNRGPIVSVYIAKLDFETYLDMKIFQTTRITALDTWLLICMIFVALAMFEYAILLAIKFGKQNKISSEKDPDDERKAAEKCRKIDLYVLRAFIGAHTVAVCTYFYYMLQK